MIDEILLHDSLRGIKFANDPFGNYGVMEEKIWQVVYLYHYYTASDVSRFTGYAPSTVRSYNSKNRDKYDEAKEFFEIGFSKVPVEAVEVGVEEDPHAPMSLQATCAFSSVEIICSRALLQKAGADGEKAYLFRFFEDDEKTPVFSKIGTSTRDCYKRLKEEIRYYISKSGLDITRVEIVEIWNCGDTPAESYESFMRALLIKKYPNTWHKNDRFFGVSIPLETFVKLCRQYEEL